MTQATVNITIEQLYADYRQPLVRHLARIVNDQATAEDLVHETFIKALQHWCDLDTVAAARSWLYRIATNTAYDHLRRRRRIAMTPLTEEFEATFIAPTHETQFDDAEPIWAALHRIPEHYRIPLVLQSWAGYNLQDIARVMGCNANTIKTRVHRAREQFRQHYVA